MVAVGRGSDVLPTFSRAMDRCGVMYAGGTLRHPTLRSAAGRCWPAATPGARRVSMKRTPVPSMSGLNRRAALGSVGAVAATLGLGGRLGRAAAQEATP